MNVSHITKEEASGAFQIEMSPVSQHDHTMTFAGNVAIHLSVDVVVPPSLPVPPPLT